MSSWMRLVVGIVAFVVLGADGAYQESGSACTQGIGCIGCRWGRANLLRYLLRYFSCGSHSRSERRNRDPLCAEGRKRLSV